MYLNKTYPNEIFNAILTSPEGTIENYFYNENSAMFWLCRQMQKYSIDLNEILFSLTETKEFSIKDKNNGNILYEGWVRSLNIEE